MCGLNPHAGSPRFGDEETRVIAPGLEAARARGSPATGPYPPTACSAAPCRASSTLLAMYHDQGLGPLKTHAFGVAVNVTLGLPIVRTSVDHGTAFDVAGAGRADAGSMLEAVRLAIELSPQREARGRGEDVSGEPARDRRSAARASTT